MTAAFTMQVPLKSLRKFTAKKPPTERCGLCGSPISDIHAHLVEPVARRMLCACASCAVLFDGPANRRFRRVPRTVTKLDHFQITDAQWESLRLPISLAFFYHSSEASRVIAMFPGPAGATESLLTLDTWQELAAANAVLRELQPDVEALLFNRVGQARDYWRVPIDECYKLVGIIRTHWRGLSGGTEVWRHLRDFYATLEKRASGGRRD